VAVAIARRQPGKRRRCRFLKQNGRLGRPVSCARPRYVRARGTAHWRLRIRARLPRGTYSAQSMGVDAAGNRETGRRARGRRSRNFVTFKVRGRGR
jgi:hypothetical protein